MTKAPVKKATTTRKAPAKPKFVQVAAKTVMEVKLPMFGEYDEIKASWIDDEEYGGDQRLYIRVESRTDVLDIPQEHAIEFCEALLELAKKGNK